MTEADWNSSNDPRAMLAFLRDSGRLTERKARLFAVACCRRIWDLLADPRSRKAVERAELFADGLISPKELEAVHAEADACYLDLPAWQPDSEAARVAVEASTPSALDADFAGAAIDAKQARATANSDDFDEQLWSAEQGAQAALLRDIFGHLPSRPARLGEAELAWNGSCVVKLAHAACDNRQLPVGTLEPERLCVLADALEEAGCTDEDVLAHLRSEGPHVRGCYVLDLLTGRG
jgi:hypothetical protein